MDKTAIKNFSIWARNKLIADIKYKVGLLGVTEEKIKNALPQSTQDAEFYDIGTKEPYVIHGEEIKQRKELVSSIRKKTEQMEYKDAYRNMIEEVAYTWFNRLIAIRFMEVNDYMPAHIRVLSSESLSKLEPDLVTTPFDAELEFTAEEKEKIVQMKNNNQVDNLFRFLFIRQCNALNAYLPKLFEKTSDYTELLLNVSVTDQDGIVYHLIHDIKEEDFNISNIDENGKPTGQVEILGWMYQYYNTEVKEEAFALLKKNIKVTKERIPAVTQLFTPDWIVRYMVENSVGRLWLEGHENESLKSQWKYYLEEAEQEKAVIEQLKAIREGYKNIKPEEIRVIDPCMGSGHILVYAFDVLMQIYESYGYSQRDAAKSIVENNIYGLDIDDRAFQLAYFAIMMKARGYNRRFLTLKMEPNLYAIQESNGLQYEKDMADFLFSEVHRETLQYLLHIFVDAKEYGSILNIEKRDYDGFLKEWQLGAEQTAKNVVTMLWYNECNKIVPILAKQAKLLSQKYDCVITNPPYMSAANGNFILVNYIKKYYTDSKGDLFAVFIEKCKKMCKINGLQAMITQHAWMFLPSFDKIRRKLIKRTLANMVHLGARAFDEIGGEVVQTTSFIFYNNEISNFKSTFIRLVDYKSEFLKEKAFGESCNKYICSMSRFFDIPNQVMAYWITDRIVEIFKGKQIKDYGNSCIGMRTGDNARFLRLWSEVNYTKLGFNCKNANEAQQSRRKWFPYCKGGSFRKWYGNNDYVVNWENNGYEIKENTKKVYPQLGNNLSWKISNESFYFKRGLTWSGVGASIFGVRSYPEGMIFDSGANSFFVKDEKYYEYFLGLLNSSLINNIINMINPTINTGCGVIAVLPVVLSEEKVEIVSALVNENIILSKQDWDSYETSWNFIRHPFLEKSLLIEEAYKIWEEECNRRFYKLKSNETELNNIFADIYGIGNEFSTEVENEYITIHQASKVEDIKSLISYAVGCILGRYSTEIDGISFAGGQWDSNKYGQYIPSKDNIIPITDEEYLEDDIVLRLCKWIEIVYGIDTLEENLDFIAEVLGNKANSSRESIRNYFLNDFFKDHCNTYSITGSGKRPIYWLFDSGKQNGFKALIYMHRYNADTIGKLRVDYLHRIERIYENEINRMQDTIDNSENAREVTVASKRKEKLQKQLKECQEYDEKIAHLALSRIEIDLDDGVKVNYEKIQTANDGKKYQVLARI